MSAKNSDLWQLKKWEDKIFMERNLKIRSIMERAMVQMASTVASHTCAGKHMSLFRRRNDWEILSGQTI